MGFNSPLEVIAAFGTAELQRLMMEIVTFSALGLNEPLRSLIFSYKPK